MNTPVSFELAKLVLWSIKLEHNYIRSLAYADEDSTKKTAANFKNEGYNLHGIHKITIEV